MCSPNQNGQDKTSWTCGSRRVGNASGRPEEAGKKPLSLTGEQKKMIECFLEVDACLPRPWLLSNMDSHYRGANRLNVLLTTPQFYCT